MRKSLLILPLMALLPAAAQAEGNDEGAVWTEIGVQKSINRQWKVGMDTEFRAQKEARWSLGVNTTYKPIKYFRLGAAYNFQYRRSPEKDKPHYDTRMDGEGNEAWLCDGYNIDEKYWAPRHRLSLDATGTVKLGGWLRVSLRERYQFTHRAEVTYDRTRVRYDVKYGPDGYYVDTEDPEVSQKERTKAAEGDHVLRSRLKLEMDRKGCDWGPFVYAETHNNLGSGQKMNLEKVRTGIGCDYKINKQHSVGLAYVFTAYIHDEDVPHARLHDRVHAANISYQFDF